MAPRSTHADDSPGGLPSRLGQYHVVHRIGQGGMATVFEGRHPLLESRVALKLMHPALAADPRAAARFLREAKAAAQLRHQHVVEVFDMGTEAGVPFLVMEYLEGVDLAARIADRGALPLAEIAAVFLPIASAIQAAHGAGIIHRDLKPANVMLARRPPRHEQPVVLDFGISKLDDDADALTRSGTVVGTLPYLAPELTNGARFASPASDQYSFSVMMYECATGRLPFEGDGPYALMHAIVNAELAPPSSRAAGLPLEFDALVLRGMQRDPAQRFASMAELGAALLSLAPRATFQLWSDQFERSPTAGGSGDGPPFQTELDVPREPTARYPAPPMGISAQQPSNGVGRRAALLLASYAIVVTLLLALSWGPKQDRPPVAPALAASGAKTAEPPVTGEAHVDDKAPDALPGSIPPSAAQTEPPREAPPSEPPSKDRARDLRHAREARAAEVRSVRSAQRPAPLGAHRGPAESPVAPPEAPADLGTNGAPIVE
jgi:serine/threonine protein kinase